MLTGSSEAKIGVLHASCGVEWARTGVTETEVSLMKKHLDNHG